MHRISPFVVIYAEFLLIAQYLYCMNLTEDELPSHIDTEGLSLEQIGFIRYTTNPCIPLLLKTLFTMTFWLTLRQMKYEASLDRQTSTLAHLAAPFQVTVSAATTDLGPKPETKKSKIMMKAGAAFKSILLQLWIWIVVFALFFYAIIGEKMTVFRIAYMILFLVFVITFQVSRNYENLPMQKHFYHSSFTIIISAIVACVEENVVLILARSYRILHADTDNGLYLSI